MTFSALVQRARHPRGSLASLRRRVRNRSVNTIPTGPAAGLRIGSKYASADYANDENERPVQEAIASLLGPGDVFYDIGANVGFFSLVASRIVGPAGAVYAFEPLPEIAGAFEENLRLNNVSNVRVLRLAVSDRDGTARIQTTAHPGGATLEGYGTPGDTTGVITVETRTIDTLVQELGLRRPSVVKIDVEGAEAAVLRGMPALLSDHPVIVYELDGATADELETNRQEVELELRRTGYEISELPRSYGGTHLVRHYVAMA